LPLDPDKLPRNLAIIMDGNGRWAKRRGRIRVKGHEEGINSVREVTRECARLRMESLTLYAFSVENWKRPRREIDALMRLLRRFLVDERDEIMEQDIRFTAIGRLDDLPRAVRKELATTREMSAGNRGMTLCLALSYGGRTEILDATSRIIADVRSGAIDGDALDAEAFRRYLYAPEIPDPDLLIRTAGEMRVSNFLLWQISYSELWVTPVCWPDFRKPHLHEALEAYASRERRFGAVLDHEEPRGTPR
jgi:undecaprenyl diphosphate synthase